MRSINILKMKILAFSDWRIQPVELITKAINTHQPDIVLYAGDDLVNLYGYGEKIYLKTFSHFLEIDLTNPDNFFNNPSISHNSKLKDIIFETFKPNLGFLRETETPVLYVNGNQDYIIEKEKKEYLFVQWRLKYDDLVYILYENEQEKIDIISLRFNEYILEINPYIKRIIENDKERKFNTIISDFEDICRFIERQKSLEREVSLEILNEYNNIIQQALETYGIYIPFSNQYGEKTKKIRDKEISIYLCQSTFGLGSDITNPPQKYSDIILTHIPPLGSLDLSKRYGLNHIGSKAILDAIKKYHPKMVICGHSHMWGGFSDIIDKTIILNVSSHDNRDYRAIGNFALIDTEEWFYEMLKAKDTERFFSFKSIAGGSTIIKKLNRIGCLSFSIYELAETKQYFPELTYEFLEMIGFQPDHTKRNHLFVNLKRWESGNTETKNKLSNFLSQSFSIDIKDELVKVPTAEKVKKQLFNPVSCSKLYDLLDQIECLGIDTSTYRGRLDSMIGDDICIKRNITLNPEEHWFVDVETGLAKSEGPGDLWLIGIAHGSDKNIKQFLYPEQEDNFITFIKENDISILVAWSRYDADVLKPLFSQYGLDIQFYDALTRTRNCLDSHTYKLHILYDLLFPQKKTNPEIITGGIAGLLADHLIISSGKCSFCQSKKDDIIEKIKQRNRLDVLQMIEICELLSS
ncbi:MAG: hypothetical protein GF311_12585 [Candidatus Lokiarchaeota archaeon]|nr:hypothetical protein [Candidatus Lokiarchaeota archaeon]